MLENDCQSEIIFFLCFFSENAWSTKYTSGNPTKYPLGLIERQDAPNTSSLIHTQVRTFILAQIYTERRIFCAENPRPPFIFNHYYIFLRSLHSSFSLFLSNYYYISLYPHYIQIRIQNLKTNAVPVSLCREVFRLLYFRHKKKSHKPTAGKSLGNVQRHTIFKTKEIGPVM